MKMSGRTVGAIVQGLILGALLLFATAGILVATSGARIFRYEGF